MACAKACSTPGCPTKSAPRIRCSISPRSENARLSRSPAHARRDVPLDVALFDDENAEQRRLRQAACLLATSAGGAIPTIARAAPSKRCSTRRSPAPITGRAHSSPPSVFHRYSGDEEFPPTWPFPGLLGKQDDERALRVGLAARLAFALSASAPGELPHYRLRLTPSKVVLEVPKRRSVIAGETGQQAAGRARRGDGPQGAKSWSVNR